MSPPIQFADYLGLEVTTFFLVFMRIFGLLLFAPIFSARMLPGNVRIYLAFAITILFAALVPPPRFQSTTMLSLVVVMAGELLIGLVVGSFMQMIFAALQLAGQVTGTQLGLALASVVNPQFDDQASTNSVVYATLGSLIFFVTGLDREMFRVLFDSFSVIPLGEVVARQSILDYALVVFQQSMILATRISTPIIVSLTMAELAMGFIGRTVPQLNILSVGFSVRIVLGLVITLVALGDMSTMFFSYMGDAIIEASQAVADMVPVLP
ncbi:flagellar biosynthetic protein FliR [bacterium]|nr:flagellar biosynthetic protein FliR [bacterium]